jgi:hypothetical protein
MKLNLVSRKIEAPDVESSLFKPVDHIKQDWFSLIKRRGSLKKQTNQ